MTEHRVTDLDVVDACSERLDHAGGVTTENHWVGVRHHRGQQSGRDAVADRVEAGRVTRIWTVPSVAVGVGTSDSCGC